MLRRDFLARSAAALGFALAPSRRLQAALSPAPDSRPMFTTVAPIPGVVVSKEPSLATNNEISTNSTTAS
jgi:hypothetical protein